MRIVDWIRVLLQGFYAPSRALREVRDRGSLAQAGIVTLLAQIAYFFAARWLAGEKGNLFVSPLSSIRLVSEAAIPILLVACVLVPVIIFVANLFERRGSFRLVMQQEYTSLAATVFYALALANLLAIVVAVVFHFSGIQAAYVANSAESTAQVRNWVINSPRMSPEFKEQMEVALNDPSMIASGLFRSIKLSLFLLALLGAVREVFRFGWLRSSAVVLIGLVASLLLFPLWVLLLSPILASPFLLLMVFFLLRGYVGGLLHAQKAREAFKRNLEAATLNPADASAHYNLGLIHQQRGEFEAAQERFERAIEIDAEEVDAHYQLGRIARQQKRLADAIKHFEQVVSRDTNHAQQEVWREIGATYVSAGQFDDAINALEPFLERRPSDPEALYLMGRAHDGLGHRREAASSMQACIEAVKTAPAYKYRADKRWLNEAQQFLRSQVGT